MKATEIHEGDVLKNDGAVFYTVEKVWREDHDVLATVRYRLDGGTSIRVWDEHRDVPLEHTDKSGC